MKFTYLCLLYFLSFSLNAQTVSEISIPVFDGVLSAELTEVNKNCLIISVSGSGPTDRDGNNPQMKNNSLKMLSDSLVYKGISTLRIDKRGIGKSKISNLKEENLLFDTFVSDISKWVDTMYSLGFHNIFLLGHSEGSLVSIIASQKNPK